jgi:hypothetical protein
MASRMGRSTVYRLGVMVAQAFTGGVAKVSVIWVENGGLIASPAVLANLARAPQPRWRSTATPAAACLAAHPKNA